MRILHRLREAFSRGLCYIVFVGQFRPYFWRLFVKNLYSIFDRVSRSYSPPFLASNHAEATRMCVGQVNDPQSMLCKHSKDYELVYVGTWDPDTGFVASEGDTPDFVVALSSLKEVSNG